MSHHHSEASRMLGVSSATLRRLARAYEKAFGELPTDGAGGRLYPDHALNLMSEARELVRSRQTGTLELAFRRLSDGGELATPEPTAGLEAVLVELRAIRLLVERQAEEIQELKALPATGTTVDLERRNAYLEGELRRRDERPQARQPWWQLWQKRTPTEPG